MQLIRALTRKRSAKRGFFREKARDTVASFMGSYFGPMRAATSEMIDGSSINTLLRPAAIIPC